MKTLTLVSSLLLLAGTASLNAQIVTLTATGTVSSVDDAYFNTLPPGSLPPAYLTDNNQTTALATFTYTFNASTLAADGQSNGDDSFTVAGTATLSFAGYTVTSNNLDLSVGTGDGLNLDATTTEPDNGGVDQVDFNLSLNWTKTPTTISETPAGIAAALANPSLFSNNNLAFSATLEDDAQAFFSIPAAEQVAPEPSEIGLLALGGLALLVGGKRLRRSAQV